VEVAHVGVVKIGDFASSHRDQQLQADGSDYISHWLNVYSIKGPNKFRTALGAKMATGDPANNLGRLQRSLRHVKYGGHLDIAG
jgi:hypothetical protein